MKRKIYKGFGVIDFIMVLVLILTFIIPVVRIFPTYIQYYGLKKTIARVQKVSQTEDEAKKAIEHQFSVDGIRNISPDTIFIETVNDKLILSFDYKQPIPLYGNLSLLMHYNATTLENTKSD